MNEIYVKIEWLCYEEEIVTFETAEQAYEYAQNKSKQDWVNYCKLYICGYLQYIFDFGKVVQE